MTTTIHQLYCTDCTYGTSYFHRKTGAEKDGAVGISVRAASLPPNTCEECFEKLQPYTFYRPPGDVADEDLEQHTADSVPKRLAYYGSLNGLRVVVQAVYRTTDAKGRIGSFFSHLLLSELGTGDVPWSAADCAKLWGNRNWQTLDQGISGFALPAFSSIDEFRGAQLPQVNKMSLLKFLSAEDRGLTSGTAGVHRLVPDRWRTIPAEQRQRILIDTLQGFLGLNFERHHSVLLGVEPQIAALIFLGVASLLPANGIGERLSFSTFESHTVRPTTSLAATCFQQALNTELPVDAYGPRGFGINTFRDDIDQDRTYPWNDGSHDKHYAKFMVGRLVSGGWDEVQALVRQFEQAGAVEPDDLEEAVRAQRILRRIEHNKPLDIAGELQKLNGATAQRSFRAACVRKFSDPNQVCGDPRHIAQVIRLLCDTDPPTSDEQETAVGNLMHSLIERNADKPIGELVNKPGLGSKYKIGLLSAYADRYRILPASCSSVWTDDALLVPMLKKQSDEVLVPLLEAFLRSKATDADRQLSVLRALLKSRFKDVSQRGLIWWYVDHEHTQALLPTILSDESLGHRILENYTVGDRDPRLLRHLFDLLDSLPQSKDRQQLDEALDVLGRSQNLLTGCEVRISGWKAIQTCLQALCEHSASSGVIKIFGKGRRQEHDRLIRELADAGRVAFPDDHLAKTLRNDVDGGQDQTLANRLAQERAQCVSDVANRLCGRQVIPANYQPTLCLYFEKGDWNPPWAAQPAVPACPADQPAAATADQPATAAIEVPATATGPVAQAAAATGPVDQPAASTGPDDQAAANTGPVDQAAAQPTGTGRWLSRLRLPFLMLLACAGLYALGIARTKNQTLVEQLVALDALERDERFHAILDDDRQLTTLLNDPNQTAVHSLLPQLLGTVSDAKLLSVSLSNLRRLFHALLPPRKREVLMRLVRAQDARFSDSLRALQGDEPSFAAVVAQLSLADLRTLAEQLDAEQSPLGRGDWRAIVVLLPSGHVSTCAAEWEPEYFERVAAELTVEQLLVLLPELDGPKLLQCDFSRFSEDDVNALAEVLTSAAQRDLFLNVLTPAQRVAVVPNLDQEPFLGPQTNPGTMSRRDQNAPLAPGKLIVDDGSDRVVRSVDLPDSPTRPDQIPRVVLPVEFQVKKMALRGTDSLSSALPADVRIAHRNKQVIVGTETTPNQPCALKVSFANPDISTGAIALGAFSVDDDGHPYFEWVYVDRLEVRSVQESLRSCVLECVGDDDKYQAVPLRKPARVPALNWRNAEARLPAQMYPRHPAAAANVFQRAHFDGELVLRAGTFRWADSAGVSFGEAAGTQSLSRSHDVPDFVRPPVRAVRIRIQTGVLRLEPDPSFAELQTQGRFPPEKEGRLNKLQQAAKLLDPRRNLRYKSATEVAQQYQQNDQTYRELCILLNLNPVDMPPAYSRTSKSRNTRDRWDAYERSFNELQKSARKSLSELETEKTKFQQDAVEHNRVVEAFQQSLDREMTLSTVVYRVVDGREENGKVVAGIAVRALIAGDVQ